MSIVVETTLAAYRVVDKSTAPATILMTTASYDLAARFAMQERHHRELLGLCDGARREAEQTLSAAATEGRRIDKMVTAGLEALGLDMGDTQPRLHTRLRTFLRAAIEAGK